MPVASGSSSIAGWSGSWWMVSVGWRGAGQASGHAAPATAIRRRCPARTRAAEVERRTAMDAASPGTSATGWSCPWRWVRFSAPRATSADVPSGATSHGRTATWATGWSALTRRRTRGRPTMTRSSASAWDV